MNSRFPLALHGLSPAILVNAIWHRYPGVMQLSQRTWHYSDFIMGPMASQITSTIVYWTVCSCPDEKKIKLRFTGLCEGNSPVTGEFPAQRSVTRNSFSIWKRHYGLFSVEASWWQKQCLTLVLLSYDIISHCTYWITSAPLHEIWICVKQMCESV